MRARAGRPAAGVPGPRSNPERRVVKPFLADLPAAETARSRVKQRKSIAKLAFAVPVFGWLALGVLLLVPIFYESRYLYYLGTLVALNAALATSLNLIIGYAGQFALAHAAFYGFGAYASALLVASAGFGFWAALPVMLAGAALVALIIGYPSLRYTGGVHFALITFAVGELARLVAANWYGVTGGPMGMRVMYAPDSILGQDFSSAGGIYELAVLVFVTSLAVVATARHSRFGRALVAIREDEILAAFLGINVTWHKVAAFMISATLAALAGAVYAPFMSFISPDLLSGSEAISLVGVLIVGGIGTLSGPVIGTLVFFGVPEFFRVVKLYRLVLLGLVIILVVILMPEGIAGVVRRWLERLKRGSAVRVPDSESAAPPGAGLDASPDRPRS